MIITASQPIIHSLWNAAKTELGKGDAARAKRLMDAAIADGWVTYFAVEALLEHMGSGIWYFGIREMTTALGLPFQTAWFKPTRGESQGMEAMPVADLAHLLILLQRIGLPVDPAPLCAALKPALGKRRYLTRSELMALWHGQRAHRGAPVKIAVDPANLTARSAATHRTPAGYTIGCWQDEAGHPIGLQATAPKWRPSRAAA